MTVTFLDRKKNECCAPISGDPGPRMEVCGAPVKPGTVYCPEHHRVFYIPVTRATAKVVVRTAIDTSRTQRMSVLTAD